MNIYARIPADPADWFSPEEVSKAKEYQRPLQRLSVVSKAGSAVLLVGLVVTQAAPRLADGVGLGTDSWILRLLFTIGWFSIISALIDVPFDAWTEFSHERKWGFSTITPRRWISDQVKGLGLAMLIPAVLLLPLWAVIRSTQAWWIIGWGLFFAFGMLLGLLAPIVLMPMFNKFTPLENADLASRLKEMVASVGKQVSDVFVMDASERTRKDNAFFAGLGATRRIVIYDNMLTYSDDQIASVVAHELGHWRRRHLPRQLLLGAVLTFMQFAVLRLVSTWDWALDVAGVSSFADPAAFPLLIMTFGLTAATTSMISAWHTRALERDADLHALEVTGDPEGFSEMMRGLSTKNLADLAPTRLRYLRLSHPPGAERLQLAADWKVTV